MVEVHGFMDNIPELMDESDVIISKPGGLTTSEAMMKGIPMLHPVLLPGSGRKTWTIWWKGMGIKIDKIKDLTSMVDFLVENKYIIQEMSKNMSKSPNAIPGRHPGRVRRPDPEVQDHPEGRKRILIRTLKIIIFFTRTG